MFERNEGEFLHGALTIVLFAMLTGVSYYGLKIRFSSEIVSFFPDVGATFLFIILSISIAIISLFLINKFFGPELDFKTITGIYGTHLLPMIALILLSFVLILFKSAIFGDILLSISRCIQFLSFPYIF